MGLCERFVFSFEILSLSHMRQKTKRAIQGISTQTLKKLWKNMKAKMVFAAGANGEHIEQDNTSKKLLQYTYPNAFQNFQVRKNALCQ